MFMSQNIILLSFQWVLQILHQVVTYWNEHLKWKNEWLPHTSLGFLLLHVNTSIHAGFKILPIYLPHAVKQIGLHGYIWYTCMIVYILYTIWRWTLHIYVEFFLTLFSTSKERSWLRYEVNFCKQFHAVFFLLALHPCISTMRGRWVIGECCTCHNFRQLWKTWL